MEKRPTDVKQTEARKIKKKTSNEMLRVLLRLPFSVGRFSIRW
jgi:hypothetical protein